MSIPKRIHFKVLTSNAKLDKGQGESFLVSGLSFAPHSLSGFNVCESSTVGCRAGCVLWFAGRTVTSTYRNAAIHRTQRFVNDHTGFMADLQDDIDKLIVISAREGLSPMVRLNVGSDLDWIDFIEANHNVRFYDYSAVVKRALGNLPNNYNVTLSRKETTPDSVLAEMLAMKRNVAVVFDVKYNAQTKTYGKLPSRFYVGKKWFRVVDGDFIDHRIPEVDGSGVVVGLRLKGTNKSKAVSRKLDFAFPVIGQGI